MASVFCQRQGALEYVRPGAMFRRALPDHMVETAEVLAVYTDPYGILHFRFNVTFEMPHRPPICEGPLVLSVKAFFDRFRERVNDPASETTALAS